MSAALAAAATARLDPAVIRSWAAGAEATLLARRADLDALNVFPVADSDTGTNLYLTLAEAAAAVVAVPEEAGVGVVASAFARGALVGARGNSGVIVGQYVGAFVRSLLLAHGRSTEQDPERSSHLAPLQHAEHVEPTALARALRDAADAAYLAVAEPVEGTVLTVGRAVSDHATDLVRGDASDALEVLEGAVVHGYRALQATTSQLPALRAAGVLDAGAWGLLLVLDALAESLGSTLAGARAEAELHADPQDDRPPDRSGQHAGEHLDQSANQPAPALEHGAGVPVVPGRVDCHGDGEFEVMYLVSAHSGRGEQPAARPGPAGDLAPTLRSLLSEIGESVAVVGGEGLWHVHVHTDAPLDALGVGRRSGGSQSQVRVRHLASQSGVHGRHRPVLGLVAVTHAPGLVPDLARAGAVVVLLPEGARSGPELRRAVDDTGAPAVLVLAAATLDGTPGAHGQEVLDGLTEAQLVSGAATFASLEGLHGDADRAGLLAQVTTAVAQVRTAVVPAPDDDVGGARHAGGVIAAAAALIAPQADLLTLISSAETVPGVLDEVVRTVRRDHPDVDVVLLEGGGPGSAVTLGAE